MQTLYILTQGAGDALGEDALGYVIQISGGKRVSHEARCLDPG